jgi:predicted acyl esterase
MSPTMFRAPSRRAAARAGMPRPLIRALVAVAFTMAPVTSRPLAAQPGAPDPEVIATRNRLEAELQQVAEVHRSVMMPMRDGTRLMTDIYVPKQRSGPVPLILSKTPYNMNWWDVRKVLGREWCWVIVYI